MKGSGSGHETIFFPRSFNLILLTSGIVNNVGLNYEYPDFLANISEIVSILMLYV